MDRRLSVLVCGLAVVLGCMVGCTPQQTATGGGDSGATATQSGSSFTYTDDQQKVLDAEEGITPGDISAEAYPGKQYVDGLYDRWAGIAEDYAPEVRTLPDGRMVQRTPTEFTVGGWQTQSTTISYNTYFLDSDNRGCNSCHPDLNATLENLEYEHPVAWNKSLGNQMTVQQCLYCHTYNHGYLYKDEEFGTLIHAIHMGSRTNETFTDKYKGNCMSCHNATEDNAGMALWDLTKYDRFQGIVDVENVQGTFRIDQQKTQGMTDIFSFDWMNGYYDDMRHGAGPLSGLGLEMPQSLFDNWEITIDGNVNSPYTSKLPDLIAEAEKAGVITTRTSKMICDWNPVGGGGVTNCEITGIPVSWLIEKAGGYKDGTTGVRVIRADGTSRRGFPVDKLTDGEAFLVYKIDGQYLDATRGYPCTNWVEGVDAQVNSKQFDEYFVTNEALDYSANNMNPCGWPDADGIPTNKPNATILDVPDGLIVQTGQAYTFHGYVDAYDEQVSTVEFSMDRGKTWTSYSVGDTDVNKLIWWEYAVTPEKEGSYCLTIRATTTTGRTSYSTQTVMVTAKDVMPSEDETTKITSGAIALPLCAQTAATAEDTGR